MAWVGNSIYLGILACLSLSKNFMQVFSLARGTHAAKATVTIRPLPS